MKSPRDTLTQKVSKQNSWPLSLLRSSVSWYLTYWGCEMIRPESYRHLLGGRAATSADDHFLSVARVLCSQVTRVTIVPCSSSCIARGVLMIKAISSVASTQPDTQTKGEFLILLYNCVCYSSGFPSQKPPTSQDFCLHTFKTSPWRPCKWLGLVKLDYLSASCCVCCERFCCQTFDTMSHGKSPPLQQNCQPWHLTPRHVRAATSAFHLLWLLNLSICLFKGPPFPQEKLIFPSPWPSQ